jgi:hypothetical protein
VAPPLSCAAPPHPVHPPSRPRSVPGQCWANVIDILTQESSLLVLNNGTLSKA